MEEYQFVDYYDLLQVSPNADPDTIRRVFRLLAKRYHPDLEHGGDPQRFRLMVAAYNVLTDAEERASYDVRYQAYFDKKWQLVRDAGKAGTTTDAAELRERLLSLLYVQRRADARHPGLGDLEICRLLRVPPEFVEFELWYLREKGWVERLETGQLAISVQGVDQVERASLRLSDDRLLTEHSVPTDHAEFQSPHQISVAHP
jgi:curved DNA-binding protein CbpA